MRRCSRSPAHTYLDSTFLPEDFSDDLRSLKEASGLTWNGLADVLGVDERQLQRWRCGTKPSGDGLYALAQFAAQVPGRKFQMNREETRPVVCRSVPPATSAARAPSTQASSDGTQPFYEKRSPLSTSRGVSPLARGSRPRRARLPRPL